MQFEWVNSLKQSVVALFENFYIARDYARAHPPQDKVLNYLIYKRYGYRIEFKRFISLN